MNDLIKLNTSSCNYAKLNYQFNSIDNSSMSYENNDKIIIVKIVNSLKIEYQIKYKQKQDIFLFDRLLNYKDYQALKDNEFNIIGITDIIENDIETCLFYYIDYSMAVLLKTKLNGYR